MRQIAAFKPRRSFAGPIACVLLLVTVWSIHAAQRPLEWSGHGPLADIPEDTANDFPAPRPQDDIDLADPEAPFIGWPLARMCAEAEPDQVEGLVFVCDNNSGGVGNIRNYIQTCLRYALEAGATGITIPRIRRRDTDDLANLWTDYRPFSYMFDEHHFRNAWAAHCPHVRVYDDVTDVRIMEINGSEIEVEVELVTPKDFGDRDGSHPWDMNRHAHRFGDAFRAWLWRAGADRPPPSAERPRAIRFHWGVLWDWQVWYDGPEFATTFGHLLKFDERLLRLGNAALAGMRRIAREEVNKGEGAKDGDGDASFVGIHLRTESDAGNAWPTFEEQLAVFQEQGLRGEANFRATYLATGNTTEAQRFAAEVDTETGGAMKVVSKHDLLSGDDLEELRALTFDQQGIVDAVVLLTADFFVGTMPSSFSVYVAMRRHLRTGGLYTRPYKAGSGAGDGLSYVGGHYDRYWENWLFMWDGMWP